MTITSPETIDPLLEALRADSTASITNPEFVKHIAADVVLYTEMLRLLSIRFSLSMEDLDKLELEAIEQLEPKVPGSLIGHLRRCLKDKGTLQ